jgi:hypothetical protein
MSPIRMKRCDYAIIIVLIAAVIMYLARRMIQLSGSFEEEISQTDAGSFRWQGLVVSKQDIIQTMRMKKAKYDTEKIKSTQHQFKFYAVLWSVFKATNDSILEPEPLLVNVSRWHTAVDSLSIQSFERSIRGPLENSSQKFSIPSQLPESTFAGPMSVPVLKKTGLVLGEHQQRYRMPAIQFNPKVDQNTLKHNNSRTTPRNNNQSELTHLPVPRTDQDPLAFSCLPHKPPIPMNHSLVLQRRRCPPSAPSRRQPPARVGAAADAFDADAGGGPADAAALALLPGGEGACARFILAHQDGQGLGHRVAVLAFAANLAAEFGFRLGATSGLWASSSAQHGADYSRVRAVLRVAHRLLPTEREIPRAVVPAAARHALESREAFLAAYLARYRAQTPGQVNPFISKANSFIDVHSIPVHSLKSIHSLT